MEKGSGWKGDRESSNPERLIQRDSFFCKRKDYCTLSFGNIVHCSVMITRNCRIVLKLACADVCSCVFVPMQRCPGSNIRIHLIISKLLLIFIICIICVLVNLFYFLYV